MLEGIEAAVESGEIAPPNPPVDTRSVSVVGSAFDNLVTGPEA